MPREERFQLGDYWLSTRPNSAIQCRTWFDPTTRQTQRASLGTRDFVEAQKLLARWVLDHDDLKDAPVETVLISRALRDYLEGKRDEWSAKNHKKTCYMVARLEEIFGADCTVADLTEDRQKAEQKKLRAEGCSGAYLNRLFGVLSAALHFAKRKKRLASVPDFFFIKNPAPTRKPKKLDIDGVASFLNACDENTEHVRDFVIGSIGTLGRPEAVLELTRAQADFHGRVLDLNQLGRQQNNKHRAKVPITNALLPWLRTAAKEGRIITYKGEPLASIRMGFERVRQRAGLPKGFSPYSIRHIMATELRLRGVGEWDVKGVMGHLSGITEEYAEFLADYRGPIARAIDAYFIELSAKLDRPIVMTVIEGGKAEVRRAG